MDARTVEIDRQQRELRKLRVGKQPCMETCIMITPICALVVRRTKEGCSQRWRLRMVKFTNKAENWKKTPFNSTGN